MSTDQRRKQLYRLLEVGRKELGMDEEGFRAVLLRHGAKEVDGRASRTTMTIEQLDRAVKEFKRKGFRIKTKPRKAVDATDWRRPRIELITRLWCRLAEHGIVRDASEAAMVRWCYRLSRKAKLQWATSEDLNNCVEALKSWCERERVKVQE